MVFLQGFASANNLMPNTGILEFLSSLRFSLLQYILFSSENVSTEAFALGSARSSAEVGLIRAVGGSIIPFKVLCAPCYKS
jgi:hypothetical protein